MKKRLARQRRSGTLSALAGLLIASAVIRLSATNSFAYAETGSIDNEVRTGSENLDASQGTSSSALLAALQERETWVQTREEQIADRTQALDLAEEEILEQLEALIAAEEKLRSTIALADVAAENDLQSLTQVYENMKPKDAAALFEEMSPEFASGFLGLMRAEAAALIMAGLEPSTAYAISVLLAGRNANVPIE